MKKLISLLLCLLLVLPLTAYAEDTESQPAAQAENQPAPLSESQPPQPSESQPAQPSQPTESQPPQPSESQPDQPSQPAESQPPQPSESQPDQPSQPAESQPPQPSESQPTTQPSQPAESQPSDHTHVWDVSYTIAATCTEEGATAYGCSACGAISVEILPVAGHKFSTQWSRNASGHWHACSACGEKADFGKHYPGPAATEEKAQICLTCGITLTAQLKHTHKYESNWTSDETGHWYACSGCGEQKDFADHTYDDGCDPDCNVCGYATPTAHTYSGSWLSDETGHWDVCTICQEKSGTEPHIPGPNATETEAQTCLACGFEIMAPLAHNHVSEGAWVTDEENHWRVCSCGEKNEEAPHLWDAGQEQEDSTILYTCQDCGSTRAEENPQAGSSRLIWIGVAIAVLLGAAAVILFLLVPKVNKRGKHIR